MTNPDPLTTYLQELQRNLSKGSAAAVYKEIIAQRGVQGLATRR